jgi:hypothetical protein
VIAEPTHRVLNGNVQVPKGVTLWDLEAAPHQSLLTFLRNLPNSCLSPATSYPADPYDRDPAKRVELMRPLPNR